MPFTQDVVTRIVNVHWGSETAVLGLSFSIFKPFGVGSWRGRLKMFTNVTNLPTLSRTSFDVLANSFLPGETQEVSEEFTVAGRTIRGSASLTTEGAYGGGMQYIFKPGATPNNVMLGLNGIAPPIRDANNEPMDVPIDLYITGQFSLAEDPSEQRHTVIAQGGSFGGTLEVQISPPSMTLIA